MACDKCKETAKQYRELREAAAAVIATARPHYNCGRVVPGEAMQRLVEAVERVDGGEVDG